MRSEARALLPSDLGIESSLNSKPDLASCDTIIFTKEVRFPLALFQSMTPPCMYEMTKIKYLQVDLASVPVWQIAVAVSAAIVVLLIILFICW